ncbi:MAG: DUF4040 domain-containing protein [Cyanobacteria bacterium J06600_6]
MTIDRYVYPIVALLPLAALILVLQVNPYQALVIRAILGAIAALVYAILGGADVALTEALVGTMLAVTLYVIAVRSSLIMRLGIIEGMEQEQEGYFPEIIARIRKIINRHYLRLEIVEYPSLQDLKQGLSAQEVHAICTKKEPPLDVEEDTGEEAQTYETAIRIHRLFEIIQTEATLPDTALIYVTEANQEEKH